MSQTDMQVWKERLIALRDRLRGEVRQMADTTRAEGGGSSSKLPTHIADLGTDAYDQEFTFQLMENEHEVLDQIKASLERIENGTYGQCEECGAKIPSARLVAIPYASLCVKCASDLERG